MSKFALLGPDNRATAFFDSSINKGAIPSAAIPIPDALWQSWIGETSSVIYVAATQTLAPFVAPPPAAPTAAALVAYAQAKQLAIETGGISVNIAAAGASPQMLKVATDADGKIKLLGAVQGTSLLAASGATPTVNYIQPTGAVTLSQAQAQAVGLAAFAFVASTEDVLGQVLAAIATGVITTTAQIDDPTTVALSAWPVNS